MSNLDPIFAVFGGVRPMSRAIEKPPTTVQSWKDSGRIPQQHWIAIIDAAKIEGVTLEPGQFLAGVSA